MIAKGKSIAHTQHAVDYVMDKPGAEEIDRNLLTGENGQEISAEFARFQNLNGRCEKNTYSFVVSPAIENGKILTNKELQAISKDFIKQMDLDKNHQYIAFKHTDRAHAHLHIIVNRISLDGKAHNDSFISKRAQKVADNIALERGLIRAREIQLNKELKLKDIKAEIAVKINEVLRDKPASFDDFKSKCADKGLKIIDTVNKAGALQGYRIEYQSQNFKASEIDRKITLHNLENRMNIGQNLQKIKPKDFPFKQHIELGKRSKEQLKSIKQSKTRLGKEEYFKQKAFLKESHYTVVINDIHDNDEIKSPSEPKTSRDIDKEHHINR